MKPLKGFLDNWKRVNYEGRYLFTGTFIGHPDFHGRSGHTSLVVHQDGVQVETLNSRYLLLRKHEDVEVSAGTPVRLDDHVHFSLAFAG